MTEELVDLPIYLASVNRFRTLVNIVDRNCKESAPRIVTCSEWLNEDNNNNRLLSIP